MSDFDHCAEAARLRRELTKIATGRQASTIRDGEDEVRFGRADTDSLKDLIAYHEDECRKTKQPRRRRRYGIVGRARPY